MNAVIASRVLDSAKGKVEITIGTPSEDQGDWFTPWSISGLTDEPIIGFAGGIDAMQSLIFALAQAGDRIGAIDEPLEFLGGSNLGLLMTQPSDSSEWVAKVANPTG